VLSSGEVLASAAMCATVSAKKGISGDNRGREGAIKMKISVLKYPLPVVFLALLFLVKAVFLAFAITPLWDIPDETGHYSYVRDLVEGRGLPLLGEATIGADITDQVRGIHTSENWIAQHPPAYYLIAAIPLKLASSLSRDQQLLYRIPRIVAALSGALSILVLFQIMRLLDIEESAAVAIAAAIGFIPMFSQLSSGTNQDVTLFLFCALASYYLVRFLRQQCTADGYWCCVWLGIAGVTKMTAWVFMAPVVAILLFEMPPDSGRRILHSFAMILTALFLPLLWMARNIFHFGDPFYTAINILDFSLEQPLEVSLTAFVHEQPVFELFVKHFYGLIGWMGTGIDKASTIQIVGWPAEYFAMIIALVTFVISLYLLVTVIRNIFVPGRLDFRGLFLQSCGDAAGSVIVVRLILIVSAIAAPVLGYYVFSITFKAPLITGNLTMAAVAMLVSSSVLALPMLLLKTDSTIRVLAYGLLLAVFFAAILLIQVYDLYLHDGRIRAAHGRYFYPVLPMLIASMAVALKGVRLPGWVCAAIVAGMAVAELESLLFQVLPFYSGAAM
jgi:hypothetical protein